jgi:Flp pilus assembly protein TadG
MKRKYLSPTQRKCAGTSLVEFAMAFPIFLIVLLGVFEVGRILYTIHGLDVSARGGARAGVVKLNNTDAVNLAATTAQNLLADFGLNDADTTITAAIVKVPTTNGNDAVKVTVSRTFNFIFTQGYLINVGTVQLFPTSLNLTRIATMRKEG